MQGSQMTTPTESADVPSLLRTHLAHDADSGWYCGSGIPPKKLRNAIRTYADQVAADSVRALGDGTVFGSAKEGVLLTADTLHSATTDGRFSVSLKDIAGAKKLGGWPTYSVEVTCLDGCTHKISMTCFDGKQDALVEFLNRLNGIPAASSPESSAAAEETDTPVSDSEPVSIPIESFQGESSVRAVNAGLKLISVCPHEGFDDAGELFASAFQGSVEVPLLKGFCRYTGFNRREVDGLFLLTNRRLLLFSMESGFKIVFVETSKRLLDAVPFPFFDSICSFFLFSVPRSIYVALKGGREKIISDAFGVNEQRLLADRPPMRRVQETALSDLAQKVSQATIGTGVWTGILSREFGVSFAPQKLTDSFRLPNDMILPEYETLEPLQRLLYAVRGTLTEQGLDYRLDADGDQLTIFPAATAQQAAA